MRCMEDLLHNVIINLRGRAAAQFILQYRLFVKELLYKCTSMVW